MAKFHMLNGKCGHAGAVEIGRRPATGHSRCKCIEEECYWAKKWYPAFFHRYVFSFQDRYCAGSLHEWCGFCWY